MGGVEPQYQMLSLMNSLRYLNGYRQTLARPAPSLASLVSCVWGESGKETRRAALTQGCTCIGSFDFSLQF